MLEDKAITRFLQIFSDFDLVFVYYYRRFVDIWPSHWQEVVNHGADCTFTEYLATTQGWRDAANVQPVNHLYQLSRISRLVGAGRLRIVSYDNIALQGEDVFDFLWGDVLNLPLLKRGGEEKRVNPSRPPERIELLRLLHEIYRREQTGAPGAVVRSAYMKNMSEIQSSPQFKQFVVDFQNNGFEVEFDPEAPYLKNLEDEVFRKFGSLIINRGNDLELNVGPMSKKVVFCADRGWTHPTPSAGYAKELMSFLSHRLDRN